MQRPKQIRYHIDGLCGVGGIVGRQTAVELCRDGVALRHDPSGAKHFIPTERRPEPGLKVTALIPLTPLFETGLIERREPTGCGVRIATTLARRLRADAGGTVQLPHPGSPLARLDDYSAQADLW